MLEQPMGGLEPIRFRRARANPRAVGIAALVAAAVGSIAYLVLDVPVAATPLGGGHQLLFCPLWAPPVPHSLAILHWHAAMWSALGVVCVDALAIVGYARARGPQAAGGRRGEGPGFGGARRGGRRGSRRGARGLCAPTLALQRVPLRVAWISAAASAALVFSAAMQGYAMWVIALFAIVPWIPLVALEAAWKYERYGAWALFGVIVLLQIGHMGEHTVQVSQLLLYHGQLAQSHGVFGQLDFETVHFVWDTAIWLSLCLLLRSFGMRNPWLWVAFAAASLHEVEHGYLFWLYQAHPTFYADGGFEGIMGNGGVIGSPLARPYLHFAYNFIVIVPMTLAFWDETRHVQAAWVEREVRTGPTAARAARASLAMDGRAAAL
jgi:hypothetical protein